MEYLILSALALVGGWFGGYFGAYAKKKGENLATHEDIDKLVDQVKAVTQTTKEIEAKISNEVWERQKRWEMKKEILVDAVTKLYAMHDALLMLNSTFTIVKQSATPHLLTSQKSEALDLWRKSSLAFEAAEVQSYLVCEEDLRTALHGAGLMMKKIAKQIFADDLKNYYEMLPQVAKACETVSSGIRKELRIDDVATPQSSGSSATPSPAPRVPK